MTTYTIQQLSQNIDSLWVGVSTILVFFMQAGFAILESGSVRSKNSQNMLFKNLIDICITTLLWWFVGYGMAYGSGKFIGTDLFNTQDFTSSNYRDWLFQWAFAGTTMTIVSGCMAERTAIHGYMVLAVIMNTLIYPWIVHWTWGGGWLAEGGFTDFAGSGIVHLTGGVSGIVGAIMLGKRLDRFDENIDQHKFRPHNTPQVVLGTFILWVGWYGFNGGSVLAISGENEKSVFLVMMNTTISAVASGMSASFINSFLNFKTDNMYDLILLCNGILAGLVSITAGCDGVTDYGAFIIGTIGGLLYKVSGDLLEKWEIDDPINAFPVHGICGLWGVIAVGLFNKDDGIFYGGDGELLGWQIAGGLVIIVWTTFFTLITSYILKYFNLLRISEEDERRGGDFNKHGGNAYRIKFRKPDTNVELV